MTTTYLAELDAIRFQEEEIDNALAKMKEKFDGFAKFKETHKIMLNMQSETKKYVEELTGKEAELEKTKTECLDLSDLNVESHNISKKSYDKMTEGFSDFDYKEEKKTVTSVETDNVCYLSIKTENGVLLMEQYVMKDLCFNDNHFI